MADTAPLRQLDPAADEVALAALAEVQFFCEQRHSLVRSPDFTADVLARYDQRLAASLDALLARGPQVIPWLTSLLQTAESAAEACGLAVALLESRDQAAAERLLAALDTAEEGPKQRALLSALRRGPIDIVLQPLQKWLTSGTPQQAVLAAEVLAAHRRLTSTERLTPLCTDTEAPIRRAAWRAMALAADMGAEKA